MASLIFQNALLKRRDCTIVLVTNNYALLPLVDTVVLMDNGKISYQGTYLGLSDTNNQIFEFISESSLAICPARRDIHINGDKSTEFIIEEDQMDGHVNLRVYMHFSKVANGYWPTLVVLFSAIINSASEILTNLWLSWWASDFEFLSMEQYFLGYGVLGAIQFLFIMIVLYGTFFGTFLAAKYYHKKALENLLNAPLSFFDQQPKGRILNRFSHDIVSLDSHLAVYCYLWIVSVCVTISTLIFLVYVDWRMIFIVTPFAILIFYLVRYYQRSNLIFKRLESTFKSPLISHINESLAGVWTIASFGQISRFSTKLSNLIDKSNGPSFFRMMARVWLSVRFGILSAVLTFSLAMFATFFGGHTNLFAASLVYSTGFVDALTFLLYAASEVETHFNSVERLAHYCESLPQEQQSSSNPVASNFPSMGKIDFVKVKFKYRSRPDILVLDNISFSIKSNEKVALIGRTGSGKSSLINALFRLDELSGGDIYIDGENIANIDLKILRNTLQIIPQNPLLLSGTIRSNLELEDNYSDQKLWEVLEKVDLKNYVISQSGGLDAPVEENGQNLSSGQKQLICFARCILKHPKILILDEATSSVDPALERKVHELIKECFEDSTILSISHRLDEIYKFDKVIVIHSGRLVEKGTPYVLLKDKYSHLSLLAQSFGDSFYHKLLEFSELNT